MVTKRRLPSSFYNLTTMVSMTVVFVCLGLIVFLFVIDATAGHGNPYLGILTFVALPSIMVLFLVAALIGTIRASRMARGGKHIELHLPRIDFGNKSHRNAFFLIFFSGFAFVVLSAFGTYRAYESTESVEFCGKVCHKIMEPEFVAYSNSPHARVACVDCHIGPGATWYVKSKLSGAYQVYAALANKYPRPIPTPIENLRPAKETCEQCHWPNQFYSQSLLNKTYFTDDETNTPVHLQMLMKIGGGNSAHGSTEGIHWHMNISNEIRFVATDRLRMNIPWIESKGKDGKTRIFRSVDSPMTDEQAAKMEKRVVDCIECHNRPTHIYNHPKTSVNLAMTQGLISTELPHIRSTSVTALSGEYKDKKQALDAIRKQVVEYYTKEYPQIAASKKRLIEQAVVQVQKIYSQNFFPYMKASWRAYPDHLDHIYSLGCFRCHDGKHKSDDGKALTKNCNSCHTILSQIGADGKRTVAIDGQEFVHPVDIGDAWKEQNCSECHAEE